MQNPQGEPYGFSAEPRVVKPKSKYREVPQDEVDESQRNFSNIMWDKRVVRGNTYAAIVTTQKEANEQLQASLARPKNQYKQQIEINEGEQGLNEPSTPRPVEDRAHVELQTDENVELLTDKPPCYEKDTQTEYEIEKLINRDQMPVKIGDDKETQIWDGELFNFDYEVEPILQVLMGKALERGRMEVLEEEELRTMKSEQKRYDELRYQEMAAAQALLDKEKRLLAESEQRKAEHKQRKEARVHAHKKMVSRVMGKEYLRDLRANTFGLLDKEGAFIKQTTIDLNDGFLKHVNKLTMKELGERDEGEKMLQAFVGDIYELLISDHSQIVAAENERRRIRAEERKQQEEENERKRIAKEERRKARQEQKRRKQLKENITETLLNKAEQKEKMFGQVLSDVDSFGKEGNTVGLLGGLIGEMLFVLGAVETLRESYEPFQNIVFTQEIINEAINKLFGELLEETAIVEIGYVKAIDEQLQEIDENLNMESLHANQEKIKEVEELLGADFFSSYFLEYIKTNIGKYGLKEEYLNMIINAIKPLILGEDPVGRKIKLVRAPLEYPEEPKLIGYCNMCPNTEEVNLYSYPEATTIEAGSKDGGKESNKTSAATLKAGKKKQSADSRRGSQLSGQQGSQGPEEGEAGDQPEEPEEPVEPWEIEFDDVISVFPIMNEEFRVFFNHLPVSVTLRRELFLLFAGFVKEIEGKEGVLMKKLQENVQAFEEEYCKTIEDNFPILTFEKQ